MLDLQKHYAITRKLAAEGMVLLKNQEQTLPLTPDRRVALVGKNCLNLVKGGGGSANVMAEYTRSLEDGLQEKAENGRVQFYKASVSLAAEDDYSVETLNRIARNADTAIVVFRRNGTEGGDRLLGENHAAKLEVGSYSGEQNSGTTMDDYENSVGYFYPSNAELQLFSNLERSNIQNVVVILNISASVELAFLEKFPKIKAILLSYLPGMESGTAIADVLCGDVNPSGRLVDTIAYDYTDYPTAVHFNDSKFYTEYQEGIYVGYRYFETFAPHRVLYPFGYGLSYTEFAFSNPGLKKFDGTITVSLTVENTGSLPGKEVVQIYIKAPKGHLPKPEIELKGYGKTKLLQPGEKAEIFVEFCLKDLASFDELGLLGHRGAWMLEQGNYQIFAGKNIRDLLPCGEISIESHTVAQQLSVRLQGQRYESKLSPITDSVSIDKGISLYDVSEGKATMADFIGQLTPEEMISLACGQESAFPMGTSGIGNLKSKGIPNPQTADGPAGIRRSVNTTCLPCGTLIACSWDAELQFHAGTVLGYEGYCTGVDILLAPSMNIHRNPLCGRNFEYLSEDPLITGKTAAALVRGMQSQGLCATIKHFAVNNAEYARKFTSSIVGERALREVYLKGFEIAVKEAKPCFIMTAYNRLNGLNTSANPQLLKGILREEWGYEGATMTDWRTLANLDDEILAGNNIKMPFGYPDQQAIALESYRSGKLTLADLQWNTYYVLNAVLKTRSFAQKDFGFVHHLKDQLTIPVLEANGLSTTRVRQILADGSWHLGGLGKDQRAQRTYAKYVIIAEHAGEYAVSFRASASKPGAQIWFYDGDDRKIAQVTLDSTDLENPTELETSIYLRKGTNTMKLVFACEPETEYPYSTKFFNVDDDMILTDITLTKVQG